MKWIFQIARILTGALFVFSGLVKLNDPAGFAIKLNEYFDVFADDLSQKQDSISIVLKINNQTVSQKFPLYAFDTQKSAFVSFNGDTSTGFTTSIKWGSTAILSENTVKEIPSSFTLKAYVNNEKIQYVDSLIDSASMPLAHGYIFDVTKMVKPQGWLFDLFKEAKNYALALSIFFCALEVILGFAMLFSWQMKITIAITAALIVFFTFLTGYSAYFNKVTDCGCFGDFIKLKPWVSFKKDLILLGMVGLLILGFKSNKPIFGLKLGNKIMLGTSILTFLFGFMCYWYLPLWDFLPYKKGNDIKEIMNFVPVGQRSSDSISIKFVMAKNRDSATVTTQQYTEYAKNGWVFARQDRQIIVEGFKSPIHDFAIFDPHSNENLKDEMLNHSGFQVFFIVPYLEKCTITDYKNITEIYKFTKKLNIPFYALTSASNEAAMLFVKQHDLPFTFFAADQKMLMTMARYNPTIYLFNGAKVIDKWSGVSNPQWKDLEFYMKK